MYALSLHTTSPQLGFAISNFDNDTRYQTWDLDRDLSTHLHQYLKEFIQPQTWADIQFIAVASGPGGFTGTRIGVVTARTIAQQLNIPLFAISSLASFARSKKPSLDVEHIAIEMQASRGELFVAIYGCELNPYLPDTTMTPSAWRQTLENLKIPYHLISTPINLGNTVNSVLDIAWLDWQKGIRPHWSQAVPFYGQHPIEPT